MPSGAAESGSGRGRETYQPILQSWPLTAAMRLVFRSSDGAFHIPPAWLDNRSFDTVWESLLLVANGHDTKEGCVKHGAPGRTRTCDPRLRRPVLYPD